MDVSGKLVLTANLDLNAATINVEQLGNGIYFVKAIFADGSFQDFNKLVISK